MEGALPDVHTDGTPRLRPVARTTGRRRVSASAVPVDVPGTFIIEKAFELNGVSHELVLLPEGHKCRRNHGHNYVVTVAVAGGLDAYGMVTDFGNLELFDRYLKDTFDHRCLNDCMEFHPTSELFAFHLGVWFIDNVEPTIAGLLRWVRIAETRLSAATWERPDTP